MTSPVVVERKLICPRSEVHSINDDMGDEDFSLNHPKKRVRRFADVQEGGYADA